VGAAIFAGGWVLNVRSDRTLINLRQPGETGYKVPYGGGYRFVTSPNYLGEILEWTGWAILTWSLAGVSFALFTAANLAPRALANHRWYHEKFADYPPERRRLIPFIW
jgi:protein-S-isoprenylcysteine O-methyltransferase Ste14